ncbi:MAG: PD-(D/E)XK nuclease domain-containing protein [Treponema sp.]|nr:PD-(D/E)XK nuclease domain-containing protein [Treponema sp.]
MPKSGNFSPAFLGSLTPATTEWQRAICEDNNYSETNKIIEASKQLIKDTIAGNEDAVANALDVSHIHVASNRNYNNEDSLSSAIYLAFIYAINNYTIVKEMTAGKGFADIVYIPFKNNVPAMIVELKHNASPESALNQIKEKRYFDSLSKYSGNLLFVGISYDEKTKKHKCKIERFVK